VLSEFTVRHPRAAPLAGVGPRDSRSIGPVSAKVTRRQALLLGAVGVGAVAAGAAGVVGSGLLDPRPGATVPPADDPTGGDVPATVWHEPPVLTSTGGVLEVDLRAAVAEVAVAGQTVRMLSYNGSVPGPTLHLRPGDTLRIHLDNQISMPTNLHTHGLVVSAAGASDNPFLRIESGTTFDYEIVLPDDHPTGVFWYHPHHHGMVTDQLWAGLYGAIIVDEDDWADTPPRVVVVSDVDISGGAVVGVSHMEQMRGRTGEYLLANGQLAPELRSPAGADERLLMINACASRYLDVQLGGLEARLRGVDSARHDEQSIDRLVIIPGSRADLVVRTPSAPHDLAVASYDRGDLGMGMMGGAVTSPAGVILRLVPDDTVPGVAVAPATAHAAVDLRDRAVDARREVTLSMGPGAGMGFFIDGKTFDPDRVDQVVALDTVEEWTLRNTSRMNHPFHLHIWPMQVIDADGQAVAGIEVRDVVDLPPNSSVTVRIAFERFPGRTLYHCHILDHEDLGMMGVLEAS